MFAENLDKKIVLILNKNWIPINATTPRLALTLLYTDNAKGLIIDQDHFEPVPWREWIKITPNDNDHVIGLVGKIIKIPTVILLTYFDKIPRQKLKFTNKHLWQRDNFTCQYTGKKLTKNTGNVDHIIPKSRGGKTSWENCVLAHKDVNAQKGDLPLSQTHLKLLKQPKEPKFMPVSFSISNEHNIKDWELFIDCIKSD